MAIRRSLFAVFSTLFLLHPLVGLAQSSDAAIIRYNSRHHPVYDASGMVASQHMVASIVGARVLAKGGNAVDAAVAVGFSLAVVLPRAGNIGGGGFMLVHVADDDQTIAIDYREKAPPRATRTVRPGD